MPHAKLLEPDEIELRRLARLMLDADQSYARSPYSLDAIMQVYDAQMQLERVLEPRWTP